MAPDLHLIIERHVAVIGAGASGLVAARELRREGHTVVVFERGEQVGGVWAYTPEVDSDPLGVEPHREVVHSSLYQSLRVNVPRELMCFRDYPFVVNEDDEGRDPRRFPGHREVLKYLQEFAREFGINELVRLETEVVYVGMVEGGKWKVKSRRRCGDSVEEEYFDAVVVCTGHYWQPLIAQIPGIDVWPGKQLHSHNYRLPDPFRDKVIILIGCSASANDIWRELAGVAKEVHLACRSVGHGTLGKQTLGKQPGYDNIWRHPMIESVHNDGSVLFQDGSIVLADYIMHCTGYYFPFLDTNGIVSVYDNCVWPLYKHVFPPELAPRLSFVGVASEAALFPVFELQSKWIAGALCNRVELPSPEKMMEDVRTLYSSLEASGKPLGCTNSIMEYQCEYVGWLADQCGAPPYEEWREQMCVAFLKNVRARPNSFRDEWEDQDLVLQANQDFVKHLK